MAEPTRTAPPPTAAHRAALTRRDIVAFETRITSALASFVPLKGYSFLFPKKAKAGEATWIAEEAKLMLPIIGEDGGVFAVLVARTKPDAPAEALAPFWPALNRMLVENLLLYKQSLCDPTTGLATRHALLQELADELDLLRLPFAPQMPEEAANSPAPTEEGTASLGHGLFAGGSELPRRVSLGLIVVRLAALRDVVRAFGYQFADELMVALADALQALCPEEALAARTGDAEFAVLLPAATPKQCRKLAATLAAQLPAVSIVHPLRREHVSVAASGGYTVYPQDMEGGFFRQSVQEQAHLLLRKARLAAALAGKEQALGGRESIMGFGEILAKGGRVREVLPLSRVVVNLGANMHAREGLHFSIWSEQHVAQSQEEPSLLSPLYKGELVLMEVRENHSLAEIIHLGDPTWNIATGDRLFLLPEEQGASPRTLDEPPGHDPMTGLLRHGDFFACWAREREQCGRFTLALLRLCPLPEPRDEDGDAPAPAVNEQRMAQAMQMCREEIGLDTLGGRYGLSSFIYFHPEWDKERTVALYQKLARLLEKHLNIDLAAGIACHPYLEFRKADALENCQKALEYAMLLPVPHVGALDSLALNISADKRFSQGDTFGAIKEYQVALMADETNGMAWNSLGICFAGLGRYPEAERHFLRALACNPEDVMALYNLGYICQTQGLDAEAESYYTRCLALTPDHVFALIRLGQMAESQNNPAKARGLYEQAKALPQGSNLTYRHFARLCMHEGNEEEAREHLHEALLSDPHDAFAMQLLARLYLDAGEDPALAASLARKSVSLRPNLKAGWLELARALDTMGKEDQAKEARLKAGEI